MSKHVFSSIIWLGLFFIVVCPQQTYGFGKSLLDDRNASGLMKAEEEIPDWKARWELARLLSYMKRYNESIVEYEKVLKERPDLVEARIDMAMALHWSGQSERALQLMQSVPPGKMNDEARILLADLYTDKKEYDRAQNLYQAHLDKNPDDLKTRFKLASILSWWKRYDESLAQYEIILKARPNDIQVRRKYAFVLIWAGRQKEAIVELQKTLDE